MGRSYKVNMLSEDQYDEWDKLVDLSPHGSIYSKSFFLKALCEAGGTHYRILAVFRGEEMAGGVGLHFIHSKFGEIVQSRGLLYYNGMVIKANETKYPSKSTYYDMDIVKALCRELEDKRYASIQLLNRGSLEDIRPFLFCGWSAQIQYTYEVPLQDMDLLWQRTEQNVRRLITRCQKMKREWAASDDFTAVYRLHEATCARKGIPTYFPFEQFQALYNRLSLNNNAQLFLTLSSESQPIAGQIVIYSAHPVTHTWAAAADPEYMNTGASAFLRWKVFEEMSRRGFAFNDLTDAMNETVAKFKSQFGGILRPCYRVFRLNSRRLHWYNRAQHYIPWIK